MLYLPRLAINKVRPKWVDDLNLFHRVKAEFHKVFFVFISIATIRLSRHWLRVEIASFPRTSLFCNGGRPTQLVGL